MRLSALRISLGQSEGYNATVFAYGQTGSGKTYTMEGYDYENSSLMQADPNARARPVPRILSRRRKMGVIPRALSALFDGLEGTTQVQV